MAHGAYGEKVRSAYLSRPMQRQWQRRFPSRSTYLVVVFVLALFFLFTHHRPSNSLDINVSSYQAPSQTTISKQSRSRTKNLACRKLPGADDVVVVLKTGSTELQDKLPIHLETTLRCYPHYILFSDCEETFQGEHIYDALEHVSPTIQEEHPDFELWRRLREGGRAALQPQELSGPVSKPNSAGGKKDNPGWKLDKWKFLPMVNRTLHEFPDKKWYVFVETDTVVFWQSLLNYLKVLDWNRPLYMGAQVYIGPDLFAHGGSGFAISKASMEQVVSMFQAQQTEWEKTTAGHWAGDAVLGLALKAAGTSMLKAWPIWQGDDPGRMTWSRTDREVRQWCRPLVSFHHLSPSVVESLWQFEQDFIAKSKGDSSAFLRHKDVYAQYVLPRIAKPLRDWDNHADIDRGPVSCLEACRAICEQNPQCLQYSLTPEYRCMASTAAPNLGEFSKGWESGWFPQRMQQFAQGMQSCEEGEHGWILS